MSAHDEDTRQKDKESESASSDIDREPYVDNTKDRYWDDKQKLIKTCQDGVGTISSGKRPLNIAIIGPPGVGKSSLLNTIFASFSDNSWNQVANYGSFYKMDKQISQRLISYKKDRYYTRKGPNNKDDDVLMPTFIDMMGFEDSNTAVNRELLNMVFFGRITEYEKINEVLRCLSDDGTNGAKNKYHTRNEYLVVDRIIFVCSLDPDVPLPINLMECVTEVSNDIRGIPVFGVMTKADKFDAERNVRVQEREQKFRDHLGCPMERFTRIKNYCVDIDQKTRYRFSLIPEIDVAILELMTQVFSRFVEVENPDARPNYSDQTKKKCKESEEDDFQVPIPPRNGTPKSSSCINFPKIFILFTIQVLLIGVILHFAIKPIIAEEKVNTICANYDFIRSKHNATIDGLSEELCEHKVDIFKRKILLGGALVFVTIVPQIVFNFFFATSKT
ncbi:unnamed protein product [Mytilus coruscus]|uniref:Uncharacterized protein n=1 Tax=Mytilus coruscus TaxID=42192 RepID=A0A6J8CEH1_MYTCO|nr:unnamed protein product [Mytilus coruscus]